MSIVLPNYSARDAAITQRPTSTAIMAVDSEDRYKDYEVARPVPLTVRELNATPYDFTIQKNQPILNGAFSRLGVSEVCFQYAIPNINAKTSQIGFIYRIGAGPAVPQIITLTPGFYTPNRLASVLQTAVRALNAVLAPFTMVYGQDENPVFAYNSNDPNVSVCWFPRTTPVPGVVIPTKTEKQLFDVLGFNDSNTILIANILYSGGPTFCQSTRYIDIVCSQLTAYQSVKDGCSQPISRDMMCRLYIASPADPSTVSCSSPTFCPPGCAPFTIYRDFSQAKQIQWMPNAPMGGYLRFEVFDDNGTNLIEADPFAGKTSINWSMTILATEN
jgi:hypothetical protein